VQWQHVVAPFPTKRWMMLANTETALKQDCGIKNPPLTRTAARELGGRTYAYFETIDLESGI